MNENTTAPASEFKLLPCCICGKQPDLVEEPRYFFRCCCFASLLEYPSADLAAEKWNSMNDLSGFETDCEPDHSPAAEPEGIFQTLKKRLASFFKLYDFGYFFLMSVFMLIPFTVIAGLRELEFDFLRRCLIVFQSVIFSATVVCMFAFIRWMESDEEKDSSL
jgi:hypothetical protein